MPESAVPRGVASVERIAKVAHEAIRTYEKETGDFSTPRWDLLENSRKEIGRASCRERV